MSPEPLVPTLGEELNLGLFLHRGGSLGWAPAQGGAERDSTDKVFGPLRARARARKNGSPSS